MLARFREILGRSAGMVLVTGPGLTQVQVNDRIELSFARVLRATLPQDPDVILIGETHRR